MLFVEPDWNEVIDDILKESLKDFEDHKDAPIGIQEYFLSEHSKEIDRLEGFDWPDEWLKEQPILQTWLEQEYEDWWENQAYEDEGFRGWLEGHEIRIQGDSYIDELMKKLLALYRERITETYECEDCGKAISEKYPFKHPDSIIRLGIPTDPTLPRDEIHYVRHLFCYPCWEKRL